MDKGCVNIFHELNNMQLKIASLFQELASGKNQCELKIDNLNKYLKNVLIETSKLKTENSELKKKNEELEKITLKCVNLFKNLESQKILLKDHKVVLDAILESFQNIDKQSENSSSVSTNTVIKIEIDSPEKSGSSGTTRAQVLDEDAIRREIESISNMNLATQFFNDDDDDVSGEVKKTLAESHRVLNESKSKKPKGDCSGRKTISGLEKFVRPITEIESGTGNDVDAESGETSEEKILIQKRGFSTPEKALKSSVSFRSPVFKDLGNRKQENISLEENRQDARTSPLKLLNEKFLLKTVDFIASPLKRSSNASTRDMSSPKRPRTRTKVGSPQSPSGVQLRRSYSREAEISVSGVRKLTQTLLNIDCFKKVNPNSKENKSDSRHENSGSKKATGEGIKYLTDGEEDDDVIVESPKKRKPIPEDVIVIKEDTEDLNEAQFLTPTEIPGGADLDETYVSSSIVRKCKMAEKHVLEPLNEEKTTPVKQSAVEKSPEYDSVPYMYKRDAVRKKADRMKLPGQVCLECERYYKEVFGDDANGPKLREILNKCSRHRDKYSPSADETPPGYWKPYLTATISPSKGDTLR